MKQLLYTVLAIAYHTDYHIIEALKVWTPQRYYTLASLLS